MLEFNGEKKLIVFCFLRMVVNSLRTWSKKNYWNKKWCPSL